MKKYIFFPTYNSSWILDPQYVLCGNPRTAFLSPISNASTFLWEQIEPDPLTDPISILPNNTSKNITIVIPNTISTNIRLRVTLNGDNTDYKYVDINPLIVDKAIGFSFGSGLAGSDNTLNAPLSLLLAPYPPTGPQVIYYTNNTQTTGVRILGQSYRQTYIDKVEVYSSTNTFIQEVDVFKTFNETMYDKVLDDRINININTSYNLLKKWLDIKVLSQSIAPIQQKVDLTYPYFIADEYMSSFSTGTGLVSFLRTPYLVQNIADIDNIYNNFSTGTGLTAFTRVPYLVQNLSEIDIIQNNFSAGTGLISYTRIPYTSTIIG